MGITRRQLLAAAAFVASRASAQDRTANTPKPRSSPCLCLYSRILSRLDYTEVPMVVRGLGFDGCDLSVEPGGHVPPAEAGNTLMPALEALTGAGLEAAMITTVLTSGSDPGAREVLGLAGLIGVPVFRPGGWNFATPTSQLLRQVAGLAVAGRASSMAMAIPNRPGPGGSVAEIEAVIRAIDRRWVGYDFDPAAASAQGGADAMAAAFRLAQPRLKCVTARDAAAGQLKPCPLGEGIVDWPRLADLVKQAKFTGPISLRIEYQPKDELQAIRRDLEFLKKRLA